ncbi:ATP-binding protein [candidate division KSB1 bacterium]|nr:ATP-binding protein [candidate division KSB1 bacterium]
MNASVPNWENINQKLWHHEQYQFMFENLDQAIAFFARDNGQLRLYNAAFVKLCGYSAAELKTKRFTDFICSRDTALVNDQIERMLQNNLPKVTFEIRMRNKRRQLFYVEITVLPYFYQQQPEGFELFIWDITERRQHEKALHRHNQELKLMNAIAEIISQNLTLPALLGQSLQIIRSSLDFATGMIAILDPVTQKFTHKIKDGDWHEKLNLFVTEFLARILKEQSQWTQWVLTIRTTATDTRTFSGMGEILRTSGYKMVVIVILRFKAQICGVMFLWKRQSGRIERDDLRLLMSLGSELGMAVENCWLFEQTDLKLQARVSELAALNAISNAVFQTLDLKQRLEMALNQLLEVMKINQGGIFLADPRLHTLKLTTNQGLPPVFLQQLGRIQLPTRSITPAQTAQTVYDSAQISSWQGFLRELTRETTIQRILMILLRTKDHTVGVCCLSLPIERTITPEEIRLLESIGLQLGVAIENALLYEEAQARQRDLEQKQNDLENFMYLISHDLKTPVMSIQGLLDIYLKEMAATPAFKPNKYLRAIQDCANRMEGLIQDLLNYARLGQAPLQYEMCDLNTLLAEMKQDFQYQIESHHVLLEFNQDFPGVSADKLRLKLVFANLIDNGIKYSRPTVNARIQITWQDQNEHWLFCVEDNGLGIEAKYYERIFKPFERLKRNPPGSGLGLALVQRIVQMHGGQIWIESTPGRGSQFYFTLPK